MATKKREPKKRERTSGGGRYEFRHPRTIAPETPVIDFFLTFEEALELSLALQACLLKLNTYKRVGAGLKQGLCLSAKMEPKASRIDVLEVKLRGAERKR